MGCAESALDSPDIPFKIMNISDDLWECRFQENGEVAEIAFKIGVCPSCLPLGCFKYCVHLRVFHCPSSVSIINASAFEGCRSLVDFLLNQDSLLREIQNNAFKGCVVQNLAVTQHMCLDKCDFSGILSFGECYHTDYAARDRYIAAKSDYGTLIYILGDDPISVIPEWFTELQAVTSVVYESCSSRKELSFNKLIINSDTIAKNPETDIYRMSSFKTIAFNDSIKIQTIPTRSFELSPNLRCFVCPNSVSMIGPRAFAGCKSLNCFILEQNSQMKQIGKEAFKDCSIEDFTLTQNFIFEGSDLTGIVSFGKSYSSKYIIKGDLVMDSAQTTLISVFGSNTDVEIPASIENFTEEVFSNHLGDIENIYFENDSAVKQLQPGMFHSLAVTEIRLTMCSFKSIPAGCFSNCVRLREFYCPQSVSVIHERAFDGCTELMTFSLRKGAKLREIQYHAFNGCAIKDFPITSSLCHEMCDFTGILTVDNIHSGKYHCEGCFLMNNDREKLIYIVGNERSLCIPRRVQVIEAGAMKHYCGSRLQKITFEKESELREIGPGAFENSSVELVIFPDQCDLAEIPENCFRNCKQLKEVQCSSSVAQVNENAFEGCVSLSKFIVRNDVWPVIAPTAFSNCPKLKIPSCTALLLPKSKELKAGQARSECKTTRDGKTVLRVVFRNRFLCVPKSVEVVQSLLKEAGTKPTAIEEMSFEDGSALRVIQDDALAGCYIETLFLPPTVEDISGIRREYVNRLQFEPGNPNFENENGFICSTDDSVLYRYLGGCKKIIIPCYIQKIWRRCFFKDVLQEVAFEDGSELVEIEERAFEESQLTAITIPSSVRVIGLYCFSMCCSLKRLTFEEGSQLETIGERAFLSCLELSSFTLPQHVTKLGDGVFQNCWLKKVSLNASLNALPACAFCESKLSKIFIPRGIAQIGISCFDNCKKLSEVIFEEKSELISIGDDCFNRTAIKSIQLPRSVRNIGVLSKRNNIKISFKDPETVTPQEDNTSVNTDPTNVTNTGVADAHEEEGVAENVTPAIEVENAIKRNPVMVIPEGMELTTKLFEGDTIIKILSFNPNWHSTSLPLNLFMNSAIEHVVIPKCIERIETGCFQGCQKLETIEFETGTRLKIIGCAAFCQCRLRRVRIPRTVREISMSAFVMCQNLVVVEFEEGSCLKKLGTSAFSMTSIMAISIPDSVTEIGDRCFNTAPLSECRFGPNSQLETLGESIFSSLPQLELPPLVTNLKSSSIDAVQDLVIPPEHRNIMLSDGYVMHRSSGVLYRANLSTSHVIIPKNVRVLSKNIFNMKRDILSVEFEEGSILEVLEEGAFSYSGLVKAAFPGSLKIIGDKCFNACGMLSEIAFGNDSHLESIGEDAFAFCSQLSVFPFEELNHLKRIGCGAFTSCTQLSVLVPRMVEYVGACAFDQISSLSIDPHNISMSIRNGIIMNRKETVLFGFYGASESEFQVPKYIEVIADKAFWSYRMRGIIISFEPGSVLHTIGSDVFTGVQILKIEIPSTVKSIGERCFAGSKIQELKFQRPCHLTSFGSNMFAGCPDMKQIIIPSSIKILDPLCFSGCMSLEKVSFDENSQLVCIASSCFAYSNLKSIELENCKQLRYIENLAFSTTKQLTNVCLTSHVEFISENAFDKGCNIILKDIFEEENLYAWIKSGRRGDFRRRRGDDFYLSSDFRKVKTLGKGTFGEVVLIENQYTCHSQMDWNAERYAKKELFGGRLADFEREKDLMKSLIHPCIVALKGFHLSNPVSLCMEYIEGGTLADALESNPVWFDSTCKAIIVIGIAAGMSFIHKNCAVHRDLKPSNIMLNAEHEAKITDFGSARFEEGDQYTKSIGTVLYMAPEVCGLSNFAMTNKIDVFSFGLVLYELVEGRTAFDGTMPIPEIQRRMMENPCPDFSPNTLQDVKILIEACCSLNPDDRPSFDEILYELFYMNFQLFEDVNSEVAKEYFQYVTNKA